MERFTKFDGEEYIPACFDTCTEKDCDGCPKSNPDMWINEVGKYEDAEESGLMLRLPCKVGDTVYVVYPETRSLCDIHPCTVQSIYLTDDNNSKARSHLNIKSHISMFTKRMNLDQIGKTVFLTREEAEQELKKNNQKKE